MKLWAVRGSYLTDTNKEMSDYHVFSDKKAAYKWAEERGDRPNSLEISWRQGKSLGLNKVPFWKPIMLVARRLR